MREAVRVCKGVRGLETNVRDGLEGFGGRVKAECGLARKDAGCGQRAEDGRRSRSLGVAFMLARLLVDVKRMGICINWSTAKCAEIHTLLQAITP